MVASLRALLSGIIDYAGLFPPAALPMDQAVRNYALYRSAPESWMLARFVCPVGRFSEATLLVQELFLPESPFSFVALAGGGKNEGEFVETILGDCRKMIRFQQEQAGRAISDVMEARLPPKLTGPPGILMATMQSGSFMTIFCEPSVSSDWRQNILWTLATLTNGTARHSGLKDSGPIAGLKLRCGGLDSLAFPSSEQVAFAIAACRDAEVPLKFTAGLHHTIRHYNAGVQTKMHGFLNVFVAGVLAHARGLSPQQLQPIIEDEDARSFAFDDAGLRWKDQHATTEEIVTARRNLVTSFGSCSFDEPRDDLRALGWLP